MAYGMVTDMKGKSMRNTANRPLPVVSRDTNIPLISLEDYEVVRREAFVRRRKTAISKETRPRKDERKKE